MQTMSQWGSSPAVSFHPQREPFRTSGSFVQAMRMPLLSPFRSGMLRNHAGSRSTNLAVVTTFKSHQSSSFPSPSTRLFSVLKDNEHQNQNSNESRRNTAEETSSHQNELSEPAKHIRDKVMSLLWRDTNNLERRNDCEHINTIPIVAGVSGGCDSVALFHALMEWNKQLLTGQQCNTTDQDIRLDITVVHFHHRQRRIEADEDYKFVRQLVEMYNKDTTNKFTNVSFRLEDWKDHIIDPQVEAIKDSTASGFSQDKARDWRRNKLRECAMERLKSLRQYEYESAGATAEDQIKNTIPFGIVLTAHHDDDSYETVLIKLLRGVHLLNLHDRAIISSIAPMNESVKNDANIDTANEGVHSTPQGKAQEHRNAKKEEETKAEIYLVRPFVTDSKTIPNTSMPGHTKDDLIQYLVNRNLSWREDSSNHDPNTKYLRNRVRNELIPLLKDLTDDSFRKKRIPALLEQSMEISEDVEDRVATYLEKVVDNTEDSLFAILPLNDSCDTTPESGTTGLVRSQALYQWMSEYVARKENDNGAPSSSSSLAHTISYETLQRVVQQLDLYPERRRWKLELGSGWMVERVGDFLRMIFEDIDQYANSETNRKVPYTSSRETSLYQDWSWSQSYGEKGNAGENSLQIQIPSTMLELSSEKSSSLTFASTTLREEEAADQANTVSLRILPPWRNSPIKLRAFLRGQKVPQHLRDDTELLFLVQNTNEPVSVDQEECPRRLVAMYVGEKWIIDKEFCMEPCADSIEEKGNHQDKPLGGKSILTLERRSE